MTTPLQAGDYDFFATVRDALDIEGVKTRRRQARNKRKAKRKKVRK